MQPAHQEMSRILPILITSSLQIKREKGTLDPIVVQLGKNRHRGSSHLLSPATPSKNPTTYWPVSEAVIGVS